MSGKIKLNTSKVILNTDKIVFGTPVKIWSFLETSADGFAYSPRAVSIIVSGDLGCTTVQEALDALDAGYPASNYFIGDYARVSVFDGASGCGTFHWFVVTT
jgi:hypothetical protein